MLASMISLVNMYVCMCAQFKTLGTESDLVKLKLCTCLFYTHTHTKTSKQRMIERERKREGVSNTFRSLLLFVNNFVTKTERKRAAKACASR